MKAEVQLSLPTATALLQGLGSKALGTCLWQWLNSLLPISFLSAARFNQTHADAPVQAVDWLFSCSAEPGFDSEPALLSYLAKHWRHDPLLPHVIALQDPQLVLIRNSDIVAHDYVADVFSRHDVREECNLLGRAGDGVYALALYRHGEQPPFTLEELALLRGLLPLLLPLLVQHARLTVSTRRSQLPALPQLFDRRLATEGIRLSQREQAVCHCLLQGLSAPRAALALGVKESSGKTYVDRAFIKLGVRSKAELYAWCLSCA